MFGLTTKMAATPLLSVTQPNRHGLEAGWVVQVVNGRIPRGLAAITTPLPADHVVPGDQIKVVDAKLFEQHTRELRRPAPPPVVRLTAEELKKTFGWSDAQLETARHHCGLGHGALEVHDRVGDRSPRYVRRWPSDHVDAWRARVRSLKL